MKRRFRRIQHLLNALPVLEASVRLKSFTKAGEQLGLSQPTVSRHISNLEDDLGVALFTRDHNKLAVTPQGRDLANAVDLGLSHVDAVVRKIEIEPNAKGIRLACSQSFAYCWLLPRFSSLRQAIGGSEIQLMVSYWLDDIDPEQVDMIVHWRPHGWVGWPRLHLLDEISFPVCSPEFLSRNPALRNCTTDPSILKQFQLLHYQERAAEFIRWSDWFENFGCEFAMPEEVYRFTNYQFMLQAALDGEGVALAWKHLDSDRIAAGDLVQIGPAFKRPDAGYVLEYRDDGRKSESTRMILDWFQNAIAETKGDGKAQDFAESP